MSMKFDSIEGSGYPTALAAFSAGASLCSTSLGSTFIILASANLQRTPIGTLIAGAAMLDDILVLVMVKIITALGHLWKGIFYACLMFLAKASVGLVVYFEFSTTRWSHKWTEFKKKTLPIPEELPQQDGSPEEVATNDLANQKLKTDPPHLDAIIVGSTMIARGGFGFLVASEAQSSGTLSLSKTPIRILNMQLHSHKDAGRLRTLDVVEDQIFLVIIWALVLCTIVGPVVSGIAVRRKLVKEREGERCECGVTVGLRIFGTGDEGLGGCHLCL
ncbi:uncharacterized protein EAF02_011920 [Botrytis sinoallii]|uniref:uncharacterized protein n=1 Tax=Botrytis sinoallii TaxID=1463999 RepID=UPI0018FFA09E|nr:uncharacterized protein EAF02_011920 [Botrytis sinoallii]KAF7853615.1 hypothetical protein EAF02_011920 [Botrytis sinoallii]